MKITFSILVAFCAALTVAQDSGSVPAVATNSSASQSSNNDRPRRLTDARNAVLGNPEATKSFLVPNFHFEESYDSNAQGTVPGSDERSVLGGSLTLQRNSKRRHFDLEYEGGATIYHNNSQLNSNFESLSISQGFSWRKSSLLITDDASYYPEAPFGTGDFNLVGGTLAPGILNLAPNVTPEQSILGQRTSRISNSITSQLDYMLSGTRSVTAFASYGLLRFQDPQFIDSNQWAVGLGYNQQISPKDTLSTNFDTSLFDFPNLQSVRTHVVTLGYTHVLNGRFSMQANAGPEVTIFDSVASGGSTLISYSVNGSITYRGHHNELGTGFSRGVTGGSGVFTGAETDSARFYLSRSLGRRWSGEVGVGYSRNSPLTAITNGSQPYDAIFTDARASRVLSRNLDFTIGYQFQNQLSNSTNSLTAFGIRHVVSIGFGWHHQPILIR